jgi:hypothetical protein
MSVAFALRSELSRVLGWESTQTQQKNLFAKKTQKKKTNFFWRVWASNRPAKRVDMLMMCWCVDVWMYWWLCWCVVRWYVDDCVDVQMC